MSKFLNLKCQNLPGEFLISDQFVNWLGIEQDGKLTTPAYTPDGRPAAVTDPLTWSSFAACQKALLKSDGLARVLTESDPYIGIGFCNCYDPNTGVIDPAIEQHIKLLNTYTEISPSGKGLLALLRGRLPVDGRRNGNVEVYWARQYVCLTGHRLLGYPATIEARQTELETFFKAISPGEAEDLSVKQNVEKESPHQAASLPIDTQRTIEPEKESRPLKKTLPYSPEAEQTILGPGAISNNGWIKLHRKITENKYWLSEPFTRAQAWIDLLLLANHKTGQIRKRGILIYVTRGQVGYSEESLSIRWKWSKGKVRRFLAELKTGQQISRSPVQQNPRLCNLISIMNYELYQSDSTTKNGCDDKTDGLQTDFKRYRNKNDKNEKKDKKVIFTVPTLEEISTYCRERNNTIDPETWLAHYTANGWMVGKNKMKNWKAAIITWEKRNYGGNNGKPGINRGQRSPIAETGRARSDEAEYPVDGEY